MGGPFKLGLKRRLDVWDFEMKSIRGKRDVELGGKRSGIDNHQINIMSGAIQEWSAHYNAIAQEPTTVSERNS